MQEMFCGQPLDIPEHLTGHERSDFRRCAARFNTLMTSGDFLPGATEQISLKECSCDDAVSPDVALELQRICSMHDCSLEYYPAIGRFMLSRRKESFVAVKA
jgi:hypothetical protein